MVTRKLTFQCLVIWSTLWWPSVKFLTTEWWCCYGQKSIKKHTFTWLLSNTFLAQVALSPESIYFAAVKCTDSQESINIIPFSTWIHNEIFNKSPFNASLKNLNQQSGVRKVVGRWFDCCRVLISRFVTIVQIMLYIYPKMYT